MSNDKQLYSGHIIRNTLNIIAKNVEGYNEKTDLQKAKNKLINDFDLMRLMCEELLLTISNFSGKNDNATSGDVRSLKSYLTIKKKRIKDIDNIDKIKEIAEYLKYYKDLKWVYTNYNSSCELDNIIDDRRNSTTDINENDVRKIINKININREFTVFSPKAYDGSTLNRIKKASNDKAITFGLEKHDNYYNHSKKVVDRMIKGRIQGSTISNQVFDIMQYTAYCSWFAEYGATGNLIEKKERSSLRNDIKYLRHEGILIYTLPYTRITKDMALIFSKILKDVTVIRKENNDFYVHVIGIKNIQSEVREDVFNKLINIDIEKISYEIDQNYSLPTGGIKYPEYFRGSMLDEDDLLSLVNDSGLKASFWKNQEISKDNEGARPLLPFNMGQIGLVLTSGCLDGTVEEFEGQYHAIKGMVTKVRNVEEDTQGQESTSTETISNKVQINLLTPNGEFIELA